jgi:hypothetical protein
VPQDEEMYNIEEADAADNKDDDDQERGAGHGIYSNVYAQPNE